MEEVWKDIPNYMGYQVSNFGRVKSLKCGKVKILKTSISPGGYFRVTLYKNGMVRIVIHQLVAIGFLNHIPSGSKLVVDHINGIKTDNRPINLRIVTTRENTNLGFDKKQTSSKFRGVTWNKQNLKWLARISNEGKTIFLGYFNNEKDAANAYNEALNEIHTLS